MKDYWYTADDGKKVHVLDGESPIEAYQRMYPYSIKEFDDEPITMEEYDEIKAAGGLDAQKYKPKESLTEQTERLTLKKRNDIINNPDKYFSKKQLTEIKNLARMSDVTYKYYLNKVAFKIAFGMSARQAIDITYSDINGNE